MLAGGHIVEDEVFGAEAEDAAAEHGIAGVDAEIEEDLVNLGGVGGVGPGVGADIFFVGDVFREGLAVDGREIFDEVLEVDLAEFAADALGKVEDLSDEAGARWALFSNLATSWRSPCW